MKVVWQQSGPAINRVCVHLQTTVVGLNLEGRSEMANSVSELETNLIFHEGSDQNK